MRDFDKQFLSAPGTSRTHVTREHVDAFDFMLRDLHEQRRKEMNALSIRSKYRT